MTEQTMSTEPVQPPLVVIFPRGQLSAEDKAMFVERGVLVAEADDPKAVLQLQLTRTVILPMHSTLIDGDAIVAAALAAIAGQRSHEGDYSRITSAGLAAFDFVKRLSASVQAARNKEDAS